MSNNNLNNCKKALEATKTDAKIIIGKNPKQACRLIFSNGRNISVSAVTTVSQFIDLINANINGHDNSIAVSKYNNCNADDELKELTMWLERMATYAKKCCYDYANESLTNIIAWTIEDWGFTTEQIKKYYTTWNSEEGWNANKKMMLFCNNRYTPYTTLQNTIKQWLSNHEMYEHTDEQIKMIIDKYASMVEG